MTHFQKYIVLILLVLDLGYSSKQHYHNMLDGDMPGIILPADWYAQVLEDPFAIGILMGDEKYAAPNRFFCHYAMSTYFKNIPLLFQYFTDPINSVYLSCALIKTIFQFFLIGLIAYFIARNKNILQNNFLLVAILVTPFFQTNGYETASGLVLGSPTFFFFYSLPTLCLIFFLIPFAKFITWKKKWQLSFFQKLIFIPLCLILPLSGPLIAPLVLIICPLFILKLFFDFYKKEDTSGLFIKIKNTISCIPKQLIFFTALICICSLYSIYIGSFNIENTSSDIPLLERYTRIPKGISFIYIEQPVFPILFTFLLINYFLLKKYAPYFFKQYKNHLIWSGIFILIFILIMPLGGYRRYRPNILRHDITIPVTIVLLYLFSCSSFWLTQKLPMKLKRLYLPMIFSFLFFLTLSDKPNFENNACQVDAFNKIKNAQAKQLIINNQCDLMNWGKIKYFESSQYSSRLLKHWNIINEVKIFKQE